MFCKRIPNAKNGKPSKLFQDLDSRFPGKRDSVIQIWGTVTTDSFIEQHSNQLIFDYNNEPTLESVIKFLNVNALETIDSRLVEYQKEFDNLPTNHKDVVEKVITFNDAHDDAIAKIISLDKSNAVISVEAIDKDSKELKENLKKQFQVVTEIEDFMASIGHPINWYESDLPGFTNDKLNGYMTFDGVGNITSDVLGIINVKNNQKGFNAVSEEFAHMIVEINRVNNNNMIQRLEKIVQENPELMKDILGEDYDALEEHYTKVGKPHLMYREVLGRILQRYINKAGVSQRLEKFPLWKRFINSVKEFINDIRRRLTGNNIRYLESALQIMYESTTAKGKISDEIINQTKRIADSMTNVDSSSSKLGKIVEKIDKTMTKHLSATRRFKSEKVMNLRGTFEAIGFHIMKARYKGKTKADYLKGINLYLKATKVSLSKIFKTLKQINLSADPLDFSGVQRYSSILMEASDFMDSFPDIIHDIRVLCADLANEADPDMKLTDEEKQALSELINDIVSLKENIEPYYYEVRKRTIHDFLLPHFANGAESITVPFGVHKGEQISLTMLMDQVLFGEANLFNRWMVNMANSDEMFNACVAHAMDSYDENIRQLVNNFAIRVKALHEEYRQATGSNDTKFIFSIDPETGLPTGYYKGKYDYVRYTREQAAYRKELDQDTELSNEDKKIKMRSWEVTHTVPDVHTYTYEVTMPNGKKVKYTKERRDRVPIYESNDLDNFTEAQRKYYEGFMALKEELDFLLPNNKVSHYKCIQKMICDAAEGIFNGNTFKNKIKSAFKIFKTNNFEYSENDEHDIFGKTQREKGFFKRFLTSKRNKEILNIRKIATKFNGEEYHNVPLLYVNELQDLGKLSLDASASLMAYGMSSINFSQLHRLVDVMELITQVSAMRKLSKSDFNSKAIDMDSSPTDPQESTISNARSNVDEQLRGFIEMRLYKLYKFDGFASKGIDFLMKYTNVATLGYNMFTGIANINIGKYQTFIEAIGGEHFNFKNLLRAEKKYAQLLCGSAKDFGTHRMTNLLDLITTTFDIGTNYENMMHSSSFYSSRAMKIGAAVINPGVFMEMGEHWIQHTGALAILDAYKMALVDKDGKIIKKSNLLDLFEVKEVKRNGKVVGAKLALPENARKLITENGEEKVGGTFDLSPNSKDLADLSLIIKQINEDMHGIYNRADAAELKRTALGRAIFQFRNHIVPTIRKRWKSVTHGMPIYNFRTQQWEEGVYVTVERFIRYLFGGGPYATEDSKNMTVSEKYDSLSGNQKANLMRALAGFLTQVTLIIITTFALTKDDDDEWASRQARYYMLRLATEARASAIFTDLGTVLVSPLAVISPLERWYKVLVNMIFHYGEVLQSGPYRGHTKTYGALMRAMPIYPQILDFIEGDKDNKRASIYEF